MATSVQIKPINVVAGAGAGVLGGGFIASKMTTTPGNKRILYSGAIQIIAGWLLRNRWGGVGYGMMGSGIVNVAAVAFSAAPTQLLDGTSFFKPTATLSTLPTAELNSLNTVPLSTVTTSTNASGIQRRF